MKRVLKGILEYHDKEGQALLSQQSLIGNYQRVRASKLQWTNPADEKIYSFIRDFFSQELQIPNAKVLFDYFGKVDDLEVVERLKDAGKAPSYEGANFNFVLRGLIEDQNKFQLLTALKEVQEVAQKGLVIGEGKDKRRIQGVKDAVLHFQRLSTELLVSEHNMRTRGDLRDATQEALKDYETAKANPGKAFGAFLGLNHVDTVCRGLKRGELWVHAAFTGELKSTLALNWCYNLITRYRRNVYYISLEMPFAQIRNIICVLHSAHPRWKAMGKKSLDYRKVRDGELTEEEEAFYKEVLHDFETNEEYCRFELWCPEHDVNMNDIRMEAELHNKQFEIGMICIDHGGICQPVHQYRDFNIALNSVLRDAKKLALQFNQGEGLPVLMLFQINRQGKDDADKNQGRYKLRSLSHANEAERSADVVSTTYVNDELKEEGRAVMCCLKNRDNPTFPTFQLGVEFTCRRLYDINPADELVDDADEMAELMSGI